MIARVLIVLLMMSCAASAQDVLILGEVHDNPAHHLAQAREIDAFAPAAIVLEMLTPAQADGSVLPQTDDPGVLEAHLDWPGKGWPDFALYAPIFAAAPWAHVYGAGVPREATTDVMHDGLAATFGENAAIYGLTGPLPAEQQKTREALQFAAHCDALPEHMLPGMVDIQRLRDAVLARETLRALNETGGPVAVITGNGHARADWGMPAYLARVAPDVTVETLGQTEDDAPLRGEFDRVLSAPAVDRPDPCDAFK